MEISTHVGKSNIREGIVPRTSRGVNLRVARGLVPRLRKSYELEESGLGEARGRGPGGGARPGARGGQAIHCADRSASLMSCRDTTQLFQEDVDFQARSSKFPCSSFLRIALVVTKFWLTSFSSCGLVFMMSTGITATLCILTTSSTATRLGPQG